jgi:outer membrane protein assembly factor BamB
MRHPRTHTLTHPHTSLRWTVLAVCALAAMAGTVPPARAQREPPRSEFVPTFSTNNRLRQQVDRLQRLAAQKQWDEWLAGYQQLVDEPNDPVLARDEEMLVGVRYLCHQMLAGLPAPARQRYRALYDAPAGKLYDKALAASDETGMREVYSRYRFSSHGSRALLWIADRALDQGRAELARVAYSRLAREATVTPMLLLRYALAARAAGKADEARGALERVRKEFGNQPVTLGGHALAGAAAADQMARGFPDAASAPGTRWTAFAGDRGDRKMGGQVTGAVKKLWEFTQPTGADRSPTRTGEVEVYVGSPFYGPRMRFSFLTFPIVQGDRVWVQGPRNLTAVNARTGEAEWDRQDFAMLPDEGPPVDAPRDRRGGRWYSGSLSLQAAPSSEGYLLATRLPLISSERDNARLPPEYAVAVYDARRGTRLWRKVAEGEPRGTFFNIPTLRGNTVFTGASALKGGITEFTAMALDAGTGEPLWRTYLGAGSDAASAIDGSPPAVRDGLVWIESSLYTLNALDLVTGEVRFIYHYDPARRGRSSSTDGPAQTPNEPISLVATGSGPVVFSPRWGTDVVALDPNTGKLLWSSPKAPGQATFGSLFAVDDQHAYICGDHIQAIHLADGARDWTWEPQVFTSSSVGYAALSGDRIYVPVEGRIHVLSAANGHELEVLDTFGELGEASGYASVVAVDGALFVSLRDRVIAFGPR